MDYTIDPTAPVAAEVQRVARVQLASALEDLDEPDDLVAAVHDCRKRCKKIRGLARLVRPALGDAYGPANVALRDAAGALGGLRDAHALLATFGDLVDDDHDDLVAVRAELQARSDAVSRGSERDSDVLDEARTRLLEAADLVSGWSLDTSGFDALAGGLAKTYRRGRHALRAAIADPSDERLHDYRKRAKYTWYHVRLLDATAPAVLGPLGAELHTLSDVLGDDHDLAVLSEQVHADPDAFGGAVGVSRTDAVIATRRSELQTRAIAIGRRLHAEKPKAFVSRLRVYWDVHRRYGPVP